MYSQVLAIKAASPGVETAPPDNLLPARPKNAARRL
jgi:hypothetical protein